MTKIIQVINNGKVVDTLDYNQTVLQYGRGLPKDQNFDQNLIKRLASKSSYFNYKIITI